MAEGAQGATEGRFHMASIFPRDGQVKTEGVEVTEDVNAIATEVI